MPNPTAAIHGAVKTLNGNNSTATMDSDSATVAVGDWMFALTAAFFGTTGPTVTYSLSKTAGTATVGAEVTPTSPLSTVALTSNLDAGSGYVVRAKAIYLPVTGAGTLTMRLTRQAGTFDYGWITTFVRVQNPNTIGAVGQTADLTSSSSFTSTLDATPNAASLVLAFTFDNNGDSAITEPTGMTELSDVGIAAVGCHAESAKKEGSANTSNTFTNMAQDVFGRTAIAVEITSTTPASTTPVGKLVIARQAIKRSSYY